jgi:hypothetical protein
MALPAFPAGSTFWDVNGLWVVVFKLASGEVVAKAFDASTPEGRPFPIASIDHNATVPLSEAEFRADFERLTSSHAATR